MAFAEEFDAQLGCAGVKGPSPGSEQGKEVLSGGADCLAGQRGTGLRWHAGEKGQAQKKLADQ
jgi:hypothetical protein